jgi:hypothetical protein
MDVNLSKFNGYKSFTPSLISQKKEEEEEVGNNSFFKEMNSLKTVKICP